MAGLALGMLAALFSTQALTGFLYGVQPNDPATLLTVGVVLLLVSAVSCIVPALKATAIDPVDGAEGRVASSDLRHADAWAIAAAPATTIASSTPGRERLAVMACPATLRRRGTSL